MQKLKSSESPIKDIELITYPGQDPKRRMYRKGYELFFNQMPDLTHEVTPDGIKQSRSLMKILAENIRKEDWIHDDLPSDGMFDRTIIGMESPEMESGSFKEGAEIVVARWGNGHSSPVHGHAPGYLHEELLFGKLRVNTYRMLAKNSDMVRIVQTTIVDKPGTIASLYTAQNSANHFKRQALIHNFTSIGTSGTLHFLPEHTRDGRDNKFKVQHFENNYDLTGRVQRLTAREGMYLQRGDVCLVRSTNVPEYGDHFIVVTGHPIMKPHGLRVQDYSVETGQKTILNNYKMEQGLTLLKLDKMATTFFLQFHGLFFEDKKLMVKPTV